MVAGCQRPLPSHVHDVSNYTPSLVKALNARGYANVHDGKKNTTFHFDMLYETPGSVYLESKQMGVLLFVFGMLEDNATLVIPREQKVYVSSSKTPMETMLGISLNQKLFARVLLNQWKEWLMDAQSMGLQQGKHVYVVPNKATFYIHDHTGRIDRIELEQDQISIEYKTWKDSLEVPQDIHIRQGNRSLQWTWQRMTPKESLPAEYFKVKIPEHYEIERDEVF